MSFNIVIEDPRFSKHLISVSLGGFLEDPSLYINEQWVDGFSGVHKVMADDGSLVSIRFKKHFFDRVPKLVIGDVEYQLLPSLAVVDRIALVAPFFTVFWFGKGILALIIPFYLFCDKLFRQNLTLRTKYARYFIMLATIIGGFTLLQNFYLQ